MSTAVTQMLVELSESMAASVSDPASYRLVEGGADGEPSLVTCDGSPGDDTQIPIDAAVYVEPTQTAYLALDGGLSLDRGSYRLLLCSTLEDLQGNPLGDGVDASLDFAVAGDSLLNPNFDVDIADWTLSNGGVISFLPDDADLVPTSGSLEMLITDQGEGFAQCVDLSGFPSDPRIEAGLSARVRVTERSATTVRAMGALTFYDQAACVGTTLGTSATSEVAGDTGGLWSALGLLAEVPLAALSAEVSFTAAPDDAAGDADVGVGSCALVSHVPIFVDGFESGDTSRWSATVP